MKKVAGVLKIMRLRPALKVFMEYLRNTSVLLEFKEGFSTAGENLIIHWGELWFAKNVWWRARQAGLEGW